MNDEMKFGYALAMQGVKEKMRSIMEELKAKGHDEPLGFSVLLGFVEDCIRENKESNAV